MKFADLFTFDDDNLPTPRQLPEGWRIEQQERDAVGVVLAYTAPRSVTPMGGRLTVHIEQGPLPPERLMYHAQGIHIGLRAMVKGYCQGVSVERLSVYANEASTTEATRPHYASRLLELLTWLPGPAGEGWRALRRQVEGRVELRLIARNVAEVLARTGAEILGVGSDNGKDYHVHMALPPGWTTQPAPNCTDGSYWLVDPAGARAALVEDYTEVGPDMGLAPYHFVTVVRPGEPKPEEVCRVSTMEFSDAGDA